MTSEQQRQLNQQLVQAVWKGNKQEVNRLLQAGANINVKVKNYGSLLHVALAKGNHEMMDYLLRQGANPEQTDSKGRSVVQLAAYQGDIQTLELMQKNGVDLTAVDSNGIGLLHFSLLSGQTKAARYLIENGCDANASFGKGFQAVDIVEATLKKGVRNLDGSTTPLTTEQRKEVEELLVYLQNQGTEKPKVDITYYQMAKSEERLKMLQDGRAPILSMKAQMITEIFDSEKMSQALEGPYISKEERSHLLYYAVRYGNDDLLMQLVQHDVDINYQPGHQNDHSIESSMLFIALARGNVKGFKALIEKDSTYQDFYLAVAAQKGQSEIFKVLLENGANINTASEQIKDGRTVLHLAALGGNTDIIQSCLAHGLSVNVQDKNGDMPLHDARDLASVRALLAAGADVSIANKRGDTPLHQAMIHVREPEIIRAMIASPTADFNKVDSKGMRPLDVLDEQIAFYYQDGNVPPELAKIRAEIASKTNPRQDEIQVAENVSAEERLEYTTALRREIRKGYHANFSVMKNLIEQGADLNLKGEEGSSCLEEAVGACQYQVVSLMIEAGANKEPAALERALTSDPEQLGTYGDPKMVKLLLENGWDPNQVLSYYDEETGERGEYLVFHSAIGMGNIEVIQVFIDSGADLNKKDENGQTALDLLREQGLLDQVNIPAEALVQNQEAQNEAGGNDQGLSAILSHSAEGVAQSNEINLALMGNSRVS